MTETENRAMAFGATSDSVAGARRVSIPLTGHFAALLA